MRNLIAFLIKNSYWFLFVFLEIVCFYFIFEYNSYQRSIFFNSSNEVIGRVYAVSGNVTSFFGLKKDNENLLIQNTELQQRVRNLEDYIVSLETDSMKTIALLNDSLPIKEYSYIAARVINNSVSRVQNFIILNKGAHVGIKPDMGVVSRNGIVGIVRSVSPNFSVVQSVLNPKTQLNCKIKSSNIKTTLTWDAKDYRYAILKDFPRYEKFNKGDTVVTSGVSRFFPEGFVVGVIDGFNNQKDDNFYTLRVQLSTNFGTLSNVLVINNYYGQEVSTLREEVESE